MDKDFIWRANKKKKIEETKRNIFVKKRQIRIAYIWVNIWNESNKSFPYVRPCLVLNANFFWDLILVWFLTTKYNENLSDIYVKIPKIISWLNENSYIMLNQIKVISKKRLIRKLNDNDKTWLLENKMFMDIINKIKSFV